MSAPYKPTASEYTPILQHVVLMCQIMSADSAQKLSATQPVLLTDRIRQATAPQTELHDDGSTTHYISVAPVERYSLLPQAAQPRRRWFFGPKGALSDGGDAISRRANVRRVRRGRLHRA